MAYSKIKEYTVQAYNKTGGWEFIKVNATSETDALSHARKSHWDASQLVIVKSTFSKYGNKVCYLDKALKEPYKSIPEGDNPLDYERFDSELERQVYLDLDEWSHSRNCYFSFASKPFILELERQITIPLISRGDNRYNIQVNHVVDFTVSLFIDDKRLPNSKLLQRYYIEAKGVPTAECVLKWKIMEVRHGYFNSGHYLVIGNSRVQKQTIDGHYIMKSKTALQALGKSVNMFISAYESIHGNIYG